MPLLLFARLSAMTILQAYCCKCFYSILAMKSLQRYIFIDCNCKCNCNYLFCVTAAISFRHFFIRFFVLHTKKKWSNALAHTPIMECTEGIAYLLEYFFLFFFVDKVTEEHTKNNLHSLSRCIVAHAKKKPNMNIISNAYFFCVYCSFSFFSVSFRYFANYCFHSICWFSFHCVFRLILLPFRFRTFLFFKLIANSSIELLSVFTVLISQIFLSSFMIGIKKVD